MNSLRQRLIKQLADLNKQRQSYQEMMDKAHLNLVKVDGAIEITQNLLQWQTEQEKLPVEPEDTAPANGTPEELVLQE